MALLIIPCAYAHLLFIFHQQAGEWCCINEISSSQEHDQVCALLMYKQKTNVWGVHMLSSDQARLTVLKARTPPPTTNLGLEHFPYSHLLPLTYMWDP